MKFQMRFNGYDFSNDLIVEEVVRSVMPTVQNSAVYVPGKHGSTFNKSTFGNTYITVKCRIIKKRRSEVQKSIRNIAGKLYSKIPAKLELRDEIDIHNYAIVEGMPEIEKYFNTGYFELVFVCHDPMAYREEKTYNINEPFDNLGTFPAKGIIEITASASNEVVIYSGKMTNYSRKLKMVYPFSGGEKIIVDLRNQFITMNGNNAMKYLTLESDFFDIPVGENVTVYVESGTGIIKMKERYL